MDIFGKTNLFAGGSNDGSVASVIKNVYLATTSSSANTFFVLETIMNENQIIIINIQNIKVLINSVEIIVANEDFNGSKTV